MDDEQLISEEVRFVRKLLADWLARPEWRTRELLGWLQGYGLPIGGSGEEAHIWLLRGLPLTGDGRREAKAELARRVATVLREQPELRKPDLPSDVEDLEKALYNLLMLVAGLARPAELAEPLYEMYERGALTGTYLGVDLRVALRAALMENQIDSRLEGEWFAMLGNRGTAKLPGGPNHGFGGVLLMPESQEAQGEPYLDAIGRALKVMAHHLEDRSDRRPQFRRLLDKVKETYGAPPSLEREMIHQADLHEWPDWSIESLPSLVQELLSPPTQLTYLIWHYILACLPEAYGYQVRNILCGGHVLEVTLSKESTELVHLIAPAFERNRRGNPFPSRRSTQGSVLDAIAQASLAMQGHDDELEKTFARAKHRLLEAMDLQPDASRIGEALKRIAGAQSGESNRNEAFRECVLLPVHLFNEWDWHSILTNARKRLPGWADDCLQSLDIAA